MWPLLKESPWLYTELCKDVIHLLHLKNVDGFDFALLTPKQMPTALRDFLNILNSLLPLPSASLDPQRGKLPN